MKRNVLERISQSATYFWCGGDCWRVGVHVKGTEGNLATFGIASTDGKSFWGFTKCDLETALSIGQ